MTCDVSKSHVTEMYDLFFQNEGEVRQFVSKLKEVEKVICFESRIAYRKKLLAALNDKMLKLQQESKAFEEEVRILERRFDEFKRVHADNELLVETFSREFQAAQQDTPGRGMQQKMGFFQEKPGEDASFSVVALSTAPSVSGRGGDNQ